MNASGWLPDQAWKQNREDERACAQAHARLDKTLEARRLVGRNTSSQPMAQDCTTAPSINHKPQATRHSPLSHMPRRRNRCVTPRQPQKKPRQTSTWKRKNKLQTKTGNKTERRNPYAPPTPPQAPTHAPEVQHAAPYSKLNLGYFSISAGNCARRLTMSFCSAGGTSVPPF